MPRFKTRLLSFAFLFLSACVGAFPNDSPTPTPQPTEPPPTAIPTATPLSAPTAIRTPPVGGLYVDPAQDLGPINPYVFGSNYGPWLGISPKALPYIAEAKLAFMRWPAGSWGDQNDVTELQVDQFIALCEKSGWAPMINVRLENSTAEKAAALVKYVNVTRSYNVRYWAIGNEPNLYVGDYSVERFNREWRAWATAMRAVDPSIQLLGPESSQYLGNVAGPGPVYRDYVIEFLKANGDLVDIVSVHRYPFPKSTISGPPSIADLRDNSREWDEIIPDLRSLVREYTGRDLPVAVTEVNSSYARNNGGEATMDSHYNAIWFGDVLGRMIRQGVTIVAQWDLVREWGIVGRFEVHPLYYTYQMYQHFGAQLIYASSDDPYVSVFGAKRTDGALTILIVNLNSELAGQTLTIEGVTAARPAEVWLFDPDHNAEQVEAIQLGGETSLTLPPESMTLLVLNQ